MKKVVCYGDSNTYGRRSDKGRFDEHERWTDLLQQKLGDKYQITNEGLNSRTLVGEDPRGRPGLNGLTSFLPTLEKHQPFDLLIWMLGTNQCKEQFNLSPQEIVMLADENYFQLIASENIPTIILSLPPIVEERALDYEGASSKPAEVNKGYKKCAERYGFYFVDVYNQVKVGEEDGVHLTKESHKYISNKLAELITNIS